MLKLRYPICLIVLSLCVIRVQSQQADVYYVRDYGAKGDGLSDNTAAFQKALDAAGQAHGGTVIANRGNYFFAGHLNVPDAVTLQGTWKSVPSHPIGFNGADQPKAMDEGTTFLITENEGRENGNPFIQLNNNSTLCGVVLFYPRQKKTNTPAAYPYSIATRGENSAVLDVELLNAYNGIDVSDSPRHLLRNISGQPLRRGIYMENIFDIGRIENVHFNPWWSGTETAAYKWQMENGEAFIFGRSDWEYVLNTFCYGYKVGYKFFQSDRGVCNGNFLGIGADNCYTAVLVEQSANFGLLIANGEFTSFNGPDPTMVVVGPDNRGVVRFSNCSFWGPCNQIAKIAGMGTVGFSDCTFCKWDRTDEGRAALQVASGTVLIRGCEFQQDKAQIDLGVNVQRAVISDNVIKGKFRIKNSSPQPFQIHDNTAQP
ncbi:MAG TPA: glycosyl hydrolase family 28-related protein [Verrucomicrobiae bacterium]|nr:glycosyl hydrolase family 28-related protein [Verrucomicrobiae bacterium]